ncbi:NUDIX hydrolase [Gordonia polyisoprenivorans]|uniref:NUDIX hydrolase n=1 Tax=Gordonia polyisoprenivorans TaxID=84595 RepID=UPI0022342C98|nr:NUDIX domain-containing protein [Gordonia polyisoprenivorans]UZF57023.1 NUDIX domain-containing protein [Gordonia polyisoprenivorans]WCB38100.1 NUDIX domain-containing protein [Gordonia polyisoprenivorans]
MRGDGDGWVIDTDGSRYWGVNGAAGLLLRTLQPDGRTLILLQHRAVWSHQGGTWGLPGGARDSHESAIDTALREAQEEAGLDPADVEVVAALVTHRAKGGWTYTTVIADIDEPVRTIANGESAELRWVDEANVDELPLHPAFGEAWPGLRDRIAALDPQN